MATKGRERSQAPAIPPLWERLQGHIDWYDRKATANQNAYKASKIAIIVCAVIIPIVAEYSPLAVGIAAGAILLLFVRGDEEQSAPVVRRIAARRSRQSR